MSAVHWTEQRRTRNGARNVTNKTDRKCAHFINPCIVFVVPLFVWIIYMVHYVHFFFCLFYFFFFLRSPKVWCSTFRSTLLRSYVLCVIVIELCSRFCHTVIVAIFHLILLFGFMFKSTVEIKQK